jgi:competence protein ComEA
MEKLASFLAKVKLQLNLKQAVVLFILALALLAASFFSWLNSQPQKIVITSGTKKVKVKWRSESQPEMVVVHVAGEVKSPGVYRLKKGSRLFAAIKAAGGETTNANLNLLNLAAKLVDGQKIYVPPKVSSANPASGNTGGMPDAPSSKLNLNTATQAELENISGIGPVTAKRIIEYREEHGGFRSVAELDEIEGIGPKKLARLKKELAVY